MIILAFAIAACTQEPLPVEKTGTGSKILLSTRSISLPGEGKMYVWADRKTGISHFNAWELALLDNQGNLGPAGGIQQSFPDGNETLNLYALSGNFSSEVITGGTTPFPSQGLAYSVGYQTGDTDHLHNALLYAVQDNAGQQAGNINLNFYHMLSKIEVFLNPGGGLTAEELRNAEVRIIARNHGTFTPEKVTSAYLSDVSVRSRMITVSGDTPGELGISTKITGEASERGCAVLLPQTVKGQFIHVRVPVTSGARDYYYTPAKEITFESGKHYTYRLTPDDWILDVDLDVQDWRNGDNVTVSPDLLNKITIDTTTELPEGAEINPAQDVLRMNHLSAEFTLAVACDNELEFVPDPGLPLTVQPLTENAWNGYNRFKITKTLLPPKFPEEKAVLRFRRKGLTEIYEEDTVTLISRANPLVIEKGNLVFDRQAVCDFGKYIDGEIAVLKLPPGKKAELSVQQDEDNWAILRIPVGKPAERRILGGWKPNDPKADGRPQSVTLTVSDTDGANPEVYTIKRRNWGLPVVNIGGTWWSKYNLRGDGTDFTDQISITEDLATGNTLYERLQSGREDELLRLLGHQYQGGYPQGLPLTWDGTKFYYNGMKSSAKSFAGISSLMVPSGYRLPDNNDYTALSENNNRNFNLGGPGTKTYQNSQNQPVTVRVTLRNDVRFLGQPYGNIGFYEFQVGNGPDKIVLYGLGHQYTVTHGDLSPMYILLATDNTPITWTIQGKANEGNPGENIFRFVARNNVKTNTMRCIKLPVEYMY